MNYDASASTYKIQIYNIFKNISAITLDRFDAPNVSLLFNNLFH